VQRLGLNFNTGSAGTINGSTMFHLLITRGTGQTTVNFTNALLMQIILLFSTVGNRLEQRWVSFGSNGFATIAHNSSAKTIATQLVALET
jgi:hypothetical protein